MNVTTINARALGGAVSVELSAPAFPQTVAGVLWRYDSGKRPLGKAGLFTPRVSSVPIGAVEDIRDNYFLLEGAVLQQRDTPPTPYQVVVTISQGDTTLSREVPPDGGTGYVGTEDVPFAYRFVVREVP